MSGGSVPAPGEKIILIVDPFTREASVYNTTSADEIEIAEDSLINLLPNENSDLVVSINARITLRGLICKNKKQED